MTELKPAADEEPVETWEQKRERILESRVQHWAGNRYTWWQLLAVVGWMRGLVEFQEIGAWRCPAL